MASNKTPPIGLRWPKDLFDLYQSKAAELTHLSGGKQKFTVSSLAIAALERYARYLEWIPKEESAASDQSTTSAELPS